MTNPLCIGTWDCSLNIIIMVVIFFVVAILRKQLSEGLDTDFSMIGGTVLGELVFIILMFVLSNQKLSFIGGLVGVLVGGFLGGQFLGDGGVQD